MNIPTPFAFVRILSVFSAALLFGGHAFAQKGKGGGGGGGGGGGTGPTVLYRVIPIESTVPGLNNSVRSLNSSGQVCGYVTGSGERFPYVWTMESGMIPLQGLMSPEDQQDWHLELGLDINESGQIVGFMTRQDDSTSWAAYRLDPAILGYTLTPLETGLLQGNPIGPNGFESNSIRISNCGEVVFQARGTIFVYPADFPNGEKLDLAYQGSPMGINCFGEIIVNNAQDGVTGNHIGATRLTLDANGSYSERFFGERYSLGSINESGTIVGLNRGEPQAKFKSTGNYTFRYNDDDGEHILMDGRKVLDDVTLSNSNTAINNHGDIGLRYLGIYTAENVYLKIEDMLHPADSFPSGSRTLHGIAERNATGLPPAIIDVWRSENNTTVRSPCYLLPQSVGN